jgi:hypothetical protein
MLTVHMGSTGGGKAIPMHGNLGNMDVNRTAREDGDNAETVAGTTDSMGISPGGSDMGAQNGNAMPLQGRKGGVAEHVPGGGILSAGDDLDTANYGDLYGEASMNTFTNPETDATRDEGKDI